MANSPRRSISLGSKVAIIIFLIVACTLIVVNTITSRVPVPPPAPLVFDKLIHSEMPGYQVYFKVPEKIHPNPKRDRFAQLSQTTLHLTYEDGTTSNKPVKLLRVNSSDGDGVCWFIVMGRDFENVKSYRIEHLTTERYGQRFGKFAIPLPPWSSTRQFTSGDLPFETNNVVFFR